MRKIHVKFDLPFNWGAIRKFGLYFDRLPKQLIMTGQNRTFEIDTEEQSLKIKLDYYKSEIIIPAGDTDIYLTIAMKGQNAFEWVWNSFKPNRMNLSIVSKSEFEEFDNYYAKTTKPIKEIDQPSFALTFGVIAYLMYTLFTTNAIDKAYSELIWTTFILGVTTLIILLKDQRKVTVSTYKSRMILNSVWLFGVVLALSLQGILSMGWLVSLIPLTVIIRTLTFGNVCLELQ